MAVAQRLFTLALVSMIFSSGFGATLYVPDDHPSIQGALNASFPRDVILVRPGVYYENLNYGGKDVAVRSIDGPKNTLLVPPGSQRAAVIGPAGELSGLTISNAYSAVEAFGIGSIIRSNLFVKNRQGSWGAGIGGNGASPRIEQNTFMFNAADNQFLSAVIVFVNSSSPQIVNNLFVSNSCAAISLVLPSGGSALVLNNTFVGNTKAIYHRSFTPITYRNNIIFGNGLGLAWDYADPPIWNNNLVYGNDRDYEAAVTGLNNISQPPQFYNAERGDYRLTRNSPAVDSGTEGPAVDINGRSRPIDGNLDGSAVVDRGAFEYVPGPPEAPTITKILSSPNAIELTWERRPDTELYIVSRGTTAGGPYSEIGRTTAVTFSDAGAEINEEYFYVVAGLNDLGIGANSNEARERGGNLPPEAVADVFEVMEDSVTMLDPLSNDSDPNGDSIFIVDVTGLGSVLVNGRIQFVPPPNYSGTIGVRYVITDGRLGFATNDITISVLAVNDAPVANFGFYNVEVGSAVDIQLTGSDVDSDALTFEIVRQPEFGRIDSISSNGRVRYLAGRSTAVVDDLTFRAFDGVSYSAPAEIHIQRTAARDLDQDGLPDWWELLNDLNNPSGDRDRDGAINADEYTANTDPNDAESVVKIDSAAIAQDGAVHLKWRAIGKIRYRIQAAASPAGPFTDIVRPLDQEVVPARDGVPATAEFHASPSVEAMRFFRIKVVP
jgi:hypothetical protein